MANSLTHMMMTCKGKEHELSLECKELDCCLLSHPGPQLFSTALNSACPHARGSSSLSSFPLFYTPPPPSPPLPPLLPFLLHPSSSVDVGHEGDGGLSPSSPCYSTQEQGVNVIIDWSSPEAFPHTHTHTHRRKERNTQSTPNLTPQSATWHCEF